MSTTIAHRPAVAIIGAGVIGLGIGWRLALAGCRVDVFERGEAGHGASWAAAGMLAAGAEAEPGEKRLLALNRHSQSLWPKFAAELQGATGVNLGYRSEGTLIAALTRDDAERLRSDYEFQIGLGIPLDWLSGAEARSREPHLRAGTVAAIYSPTDHQVDNRQLAVALKGAFQKAGGRLHERAEVVGIAIEDGRAAGVDLPNGQHRSDVIILAAGAWSRAIPGLPAAAQLPVRPIKGQMLALRMDPAAPLVRHVLWAPRIYLVPRASGRLIVGATVEERGFDATLTAGGVLAILETAWRAVPAIEELAVEEMWVGFRPGSPDDGPILGPGPIDGLVIATGHHRNGILLTPITAMAISDYVLTGEVPDAIRPFGINRFFSDPASARGKECMPAFE
jgi:glycine oxidase